MKVLFKLVLLALPAGSHHFSCGLDAHYSFIFIFQDKNEEQMRQLWQKFSEKLSFMLEFMKPFYKYSAIVQILMKGKKIRVM